MTPQIVFHVAQDVAHDDPFGAQPLPDLAELTGPLASLLSQPPTPGRGVWSTNTDIASVKSLTALDLKNAVVEVKACSTTIAITTRPIHDIYRQLLVVCECSPAGDNNGIVTLLFTLSAPSHNVHTKWKLDDGIPFVRTVVAKSGKLTVEDYVRFLDETYFGVKGFLLNANHVVVVTSYIKTPSDINIALEQPLVEWKKTQLRQQYENGLGSPARR
jgi:hypothetical protein